MLRLSWVTMSIFVHTRTAHRPAPAGAAFSGQRTRPSFDCTRIRIPSAHGSSLKSTASEPGPKNTKRSARTQGALTIRQQDRRSGTRRRGTCTGPGGQSQLAVFQFLANNSSGSLFLAQRCAFAGLAGERGCHHACCAAESLRPTTAGQRVVHDRSCLSERNPAAPRGAFGHGIRACVCSRLTALISHGSAHRKHSFTLAVFRDVWVCIRHLGVPPNERRAAQCHGLLQKGGPTRVEGLPLPHLSRARPLSRALSLSLLPSLPSLSLLENCRAGLVGKKKTEGRRKSLTWKMTV
jgi:hypothetical protein